MANNIIGLKELRQNIGEYIAQVKKGKSFIIVKRSKPVLKISSPEDETDSWQETMEVMREFPDLEKDIEEAMDDYKKGRCITLEELLSKEKQTISQKNVLSGRHTEKSSKRSKSAR